MRRKFRIFRAVDLVFFAGVLGVLGIVGLAFEAGRAMSVARELRVSVVLAGEQALQSYADHRDRNLAEEAAAAVLAEKSNGIAVLNLTDFALSEPSGTLRVVGTAPVEIKALKLLGVGGIEIDHVHIAPLLPNRLASR
jgi:hypothetical protein